MEEILWNEGAPAAENYRQLGQALARCGDVFVTALGNLQWITEHGQGLVSGPDALGAVITDRLRVRVLKGEKITSLIPSVHLRQMPRSKWFRDCFEVVDQITAVPLYLEDFSLTTAGYNNGGEGYRIYSRQKGEGRIDRTLDAINSFLDVMDFATNADRTNCVAAALTVMMRNHFLGGKPLVVVTATKSHSGKDTCISFAAGVHKSWPISFQHTGWAMEHSMVVALQSHPDLGVLAVENARLDGHHKILASAPLERITTNPRLSLCSARAGEIDRPNDIVITLSTNHGALSEDCLNRSLSFHLSPRGDIADRLACKIGNPKEEYLPAHREAIAAELRGMIEKWKEAGRPHSPPGQHPFSEPRTTPTMQDVVVKSTSSSTKVLANLRIIRMTHLLAQAVR